uniref:Uncharacterized protein n=1 Tax=viral metagenome TaxID=1070528 RepID=A0A6M3LCE5_9ZZZZ
MEITDEEYQQLQDDLEEARTDAARFEDELAFEQDAHEDTKRSLEEIRKVLDDIRDQCQDALR